MATYTSNYGWTKPSGSDNVDISVLNDNLDDQDSTIHDAFLNMAPPFSESSTYAVNDIVLYDTGLYKCHTAVVTPGSWTGSTNWQVYKLSEGGSGGGGTSNYNDLSNKPSINGVELSGNKTTSDLGLQDELTFDNVPTDGSNNPVKSDGIYDSEKDIYAVMGQMGAKNLIPYPYYEDTEEDRGITWINNVDGTITITGTATADSAHNLSQRTNTGTLYLPNGKYKLSGCPSEGSDSTYYLEALCTKNSSAKSLGIDNGTGVDITVNGDDYGMDGAYIMVRGIVKNGYAVTNPIIFKPMLRLASDTDGTYQPYAKTNRELTDEIANLTAEDITYDNTDSGLTATDVQGAIDELDDALDKLKANTMRGADTLSFDTEYIASSDGYIRGIVNHGSGKFVQIMLYFSAAAAYGLAAKVGDSPNENQACVVYVRKGMKYKVNCSSINDATCTFIPLS